ncbi:hypothetical protein ACN28E_55110 [Archangium lansingense]|uniref:hypothetical protein n=1 Tax=Archangium lansingense TaxID=2995310 RepID=UPI003B77FF4E
MVQERCVESTAKVKDADAAFECGLRRMHAAVFAKQADEAAYAAVVENLRARMPQSGTPGEAPVIEDTHTEAGWPCARTTIVEPARDGHGPKLVSIVLVRWPEKGVVFTVMFEGEIWSASEAATEVVRQTLTRDAHALQVSLGPAAM